MDRWQKAEGVVCSTGKGDKRGVNEYVRKAAWVSPVSWEKPVVILRWDTR